MIELRNLTLDDIESLAVGAWILGNEYAYFDLWNPSHYHLGYDTFSLTTLYPEGGTS